MCEGIWVLHVLVLVWVACVSAGQNKSSHLNILSAVFGPHVTTFMQILPFYINSNYNVWRFGTASFESTLKALFPKGTRISSCVNVFVRACISVFVCVLCL